MGSLYYQLFVFMLVIAFGVCEREKHSMNCENGVCYRDEDEGPCVIKDDKPRLYRWEPIKKGYVRELELEPGKKYKMVTVSNKPPIFEIPNFLSPSECEHIKQLAVKKGLHTSITHFDKRLLEKRKGIIGHAGGAASHFESWNKNKDDVITKDEIIHFGENYKYLYLDMEEVEEMIKKLDLKQFDDGVITSLEFVDFPTAAIDAYMNTLKEHHPRHRERYSNQAWLDQGKKSDNIMKGLRTRITKLTRLSKKFIAGGEPVQVVRYSKHGHYNGHYDSQSINSHPGFKCCHTIGAHPTQCRLCRYATILYYLNDVPEGGYTAFPAADNETYSEEVFVKTTKGDRFNLLRYCKDSRLLVTAEKGKAILWYNHFVDESNGFLGERDDYTIHGGCGVKKGHKWIANNWLTALDVENIKYQSSFDDTNDPDTTTRRFD